MAGRYCDGTIDPRDGKYHWRPTVFIAPVPYRPASYLLDLVDADAATRFEALPAATVVDFLKLMKTARGVTYTHAWWDTYPALTWLGGSAVLIGLVWPTVINLIAFRSLWRPPEEKGISLMGAGASGPAAAAGREPTADELAELERINAELESELAAGARAAGPAGPAPAEPAPAALAGGPLDPLAPIAPGEERVFGAAAEDFYPTAAHAAPRKAGGSANGQAKGDDSNAAGSRRSK